MAKQRHEHYAVVVERVESNPCQTAVVVERVERLGSTP
jgi:hypothetical protein